MTTLALRARKAQYLVVELVWPGRSPVNVGVLLLDADSDRLFLRFRSDWRDIVDADEVEVFSALEDDLTRQASELGGEKLLAALEDSLSNVLRLGPRESIAVSDFPKALDRLYRTLVSGESASRAEVVPFVTHLPLYSLRAAATRFGEDMEVEPLDWIHVPEGLRLNADMFVARVVGRSMEPLIPDGSLCIFRHTVVGSRQGKLLLIQNRAASATGGEFTIKRYSSRKVVSPDGWRHERIRLEPLNPEFEAWDLEPAELDEGAYRVCGEFISVLPYEEQ